MRTMYGDEGGRKSGFMRVKKKNFGLVNTGRNKMKGSDDDKMPWNDWARALIRKHGTICLD
jgi:hypothetical protein